jgi:hypothetical protein
VSQSEGEEKGEGEQWLASLLGYPPPLAKLCHHGRATLIDIQPAWKCSKCRTCVAETELAIWVLTFVGAKTFKLTSLCRVRMLSDCRFAVAHLLSEDNIVIGERYVPIQSPGAHQYPDSMRESSEFEILESENADLGELQTSSGMVASTTKGRTSIIWCHGYDKLMDDALHRCCAYCELSYSIRTSGGSFLMECRFPFDQVCTGSVVRSAHSKSTIAQKNTSPTTVSLMISRPSRLQ